MWIKLQEYKRYDHISSEFDGIVAQIGSEQFTLNSDMQPSINETVVNEWFKSDENSSKYITYFPGIVWNGENAGITIKYARSDDGTSYIQCYQPYDADDGHELQTKDIYTYYRRSNNSRTHLYHAFQYGVEDDDCECIISVVQLTPEFKHIKKMKLENYSLVSEIYYPYIATSYFDTQIIDLRTMKCVREITPPNMCGHYLCVVNEDLYYVYNNKLMEDNKCVIEIGENIRSIYAINNRYICIQLPSDLAHIYDTKVRRIVSNQHIDKIFDDGWYINGSGSLCSVHGFNPLNVRNIGTIVTAVGNFVATDKKIYKLVADMRVFNSFTDVFIVSHNKTYQ